MTLRYSLTLRDLQADAIATDAGSGAKIKIYSGAQPASVATAPSGTLLATLTVAGTFGTTPTQGRLDFATVTSDTTTVVAGTAGWFRVTKSDGTTGVIDGECGIAASGKELILNTTTFTAGGTVAISSGQITVGNA